MAPPPADWLFDVKALSQGAREAGRVDEAGKTRRLR